MSSLKERNVEQQLVKAVKHHGGLCPKFVSPGTDGMPDRIVLLPKGRVAFVEVKAPGRRARPLQEARHRQLRGLGFRVCVLDDPEKIEELIRETEGGDAE